MNTYDMERAVNETREQIKEADRLATSLANILRGRLRHVNSAGALKELKRELRDYNIHTGTWKQ
jgi:hypothetical protein